VSVRNQQPADTVQATAPGMKAQVMSALRWSALAKLAGQIVNWGITLFVIRLLTPADYGLVAMLTLVMTFVAMIGDMGFGSSIVQASTLEKEDIRRTFGAALILNALVCGLMLIAAPAIAAFYGETRLVDMTRVSAIGFLGSGIASIYSGLLQREMRFRTSARIDILTGIAGNVGTLGLALCGFGPWALVLGSLIGVPVRVGLLLSSATRIYSPSFRLGETRKLWGFGGNLLITRIVWYWSSQADLLIAGKYLGKDLLGFYSVAVHLASLPMQRAAGIINGVAFAAFAKIQHDSRAVAANTRLGVRLMAFATFPILWGIGAVAPELVRVAIGPAWQESILPLTLIALTIPFRMIGSIISTTIMSMGRVDIAMITNVIGFFLLVPLFYVGARYGIVGLSVAWLVVTPLMFMLNMFRALPTLGLSMPGVISEIWRPLLSAAVMFVAVEGARRLLDGIGDVPRFAALVAFGAAIYCICAWLVNRAATIEALVLIFPSRFAHLRAASYTAS